jgi:hypothetical protein
MTRILIPPSQLGPGDQILGTNDKSYKHTDTVIARNTILVGNRVSVLVARPTSKRHVRVLFNPQTALLVERPDVIVHDPSSS